MLIGFLVGIYMYILLVIYFSCVIQLNLISQMFLLVFKMYGRTFLKMIYKIIHVSFYFYSVPKVYFIIFVSFL